MSGWSKYKRGNKMERVMDTWIVVVTSLGVLSRLPEMMLTSFPGSASLFSVAFGGGFSNFLCTEIRLKGEAYHSARVLCDHHYTS